LGIAQLHFQTCPYFHFAIAVKMIFFSHYACFF